MRQIHLFIFLTAVLNFFSLAEAAVVTEDDFYIYTTRGWDEITDDCQRDLMLYFNQKIINDVLEPMQIPMDWIEGTNTLLLGSLDVYQNTNTQIQTQASAFASNNDIQLSDLIPTGFIIGIGVNGMGNVVVGLGGTALLTLAVVPVEVDRMDKTTNETETYYEASWSIGGIGQGNVGVGAQAGIGAHGAIGIIWGPLPNASDLTGWAAGITAEIDEEYGIGFKAALIYNTTTQLTNLAALATFDAGTEEGGSVNASLFYFMTASEVFDFIYKQFLNDVEGQETIDQATLQSVST